MRRATRFLLLGLAATAPGNVQALAQPADQFQSAPVVAPQPAPAPRPAPRPSPRREADPDSGAAVPRSAPGYPPSYAPPSYAAPASPAGYDGRYVGEVRLQPGQNEASKFGMSIAGQIPVYEVCDSAAIPQSIDIRGGQFSLLFNRTNNTVVTGTVGSDGSLNGFGASYFGGARLSARIQGNELVGTVGSIGCKFEIRLRRQ